MSSSSPGRRIENPLDTYVSHFGPIDALGLESGVQRVTFDQCVYNLQVAADNEEPKRIRKSTC